MTKIRDFTSKQSVWQGYNFFNDEAVQAAQNAPN